MSCFILGAKKNEKGNDIHYTFDIGFQKGGTGNGFHEMFDF